MSISNQGSRKLKAQKQPASYLFQERLFEKDFQNTSKILQEHILIFQERQNVLEHIKISMRAFSKFCKNAYNFLGGENIVRTDHIFHEILSKISLEHQKNIRTLEDFPGERNTIRTDQIFQESFLKILQEHIRFSRRKKYHKNRSNFLGELSKILLKSDTIFQETIPPRTYFFLPRRILSKLHTL